MGTKILYRRKNIRRNSESDMVVKENVGRRRRRRRKRRRRTYLCTQLMTSRNDAPQVHASFVNFFTPSSPNVIWVVK
jgi:hypothetical protein